MATVGVAKQVTNAPESSEHLNSIIADLKKLVLPFFCDFLSFFYRFLSFFEVIFYQNMMLGSAIMLLTCSDDSGALVTCLATPVLASEHNKTPLTLFLEKADPDV